MSSFIDFSSTYHFIILLNVGFIVLIEIFKHDVNSSHRPPHIVPQTRQKDAKL